jgi:hypothetical protein
MSRLVPSTPSTEDTQALQPLQSDLASNDQCVSQHSQCFVVKNYHYRSVEHLMSRMRQPRTDDLPITTTGVTRSLPNTPRTHAPSNAFTSRTVPNSPEEMFRGVPPFDGNNPHRDPRRPVLVQFESVSEWYRALEMIRSAEVDRDKARSAGGQSREQPIWARLL